MCMVLICILVCILHSLHENVTVNLNIGQSSACYLILLPWLLDETGRRCDKNSVCNGFGDCKDSDRCDGNGWCGFDNASRRRGVARVYEIAQSHHWFGYDVDNTRCSGNIRFNNLTCLTKDNMAIAD